MREGDWLAERFEEHRRRLRAIAYRILGSPSDADDAVQEAWLRFSRSDTSAVDNLGSWLSTVVSRVCLNMLQARTSRPRPPADPDLPEPIANPTESPEHQTLLADSIGLALLVVLDTLMPSERVAFVLHDIFAIPFDQIAPDRQPQHASDPPTRKPRPRACATAGRDPASRPTPSVRARRCLPRRRPKRRLRRCSPSLTPTSSSAPTSKPSSWAQPKRPEGQNTSPPSHDSPAAPNPRSSTARRRQSGCQAANSESSGTFTTSGHRITAIDLIADPDRLRHINLVIPEDP